MYYPCYIIDNNDKNNKNLPYIFEHNEIEETSSSKNLEKNMLILLLNKY